MKRILTVFWILVLSIFALTACGCDHLDKNDDGKCDTCGETFMDGSDVAHTCTPGSAVTENLVEPNCIATGSCDEVTYCKDCGKELSRTAKTLEISTIHKYVDRVCTVCEWAQPNIGPQQYVRCDKNGNADENGVYLLFGEYPQSIKAEEVEITKTQDARGYYRGSDGFYYAKVIADPWESTYRFSNGEAALGGTVYYFKVEPIRWRILSEEKGFARILCDSIISSMPYQSDISFIGGKPVTSANGAPSGTNANNYVHSDLRAWLNTTFYNTAFDEFEQDIIRLTTVDNSAESMGYAESNFACEETKDHVFLPSVSEITKAEYGFAASANAVDSARRMLTSDYARAIGAYMNAGGGYFGVGCWWLRSAYGYNGASARFVYFAGNATDAYAVEKTEYGIVPALQILL